MLAAGVPAIQATRAAQRIARSANQLAQLIDDLLDVSRIIKGSLRLELQPVQLGPVIDAALESVRAAADAKRIELHPLLEEEGLTVTGDQIRLQQIIWNLLSNAVKYTPAGGEVHVTLERVQSEARIVVSDTGFGITAEFLPFVFDRFRQADSTSTRAVGGLGLGLAIVRHLVDLHGGSVRAESAGEHQGATFTVTLPIRAVQHNRGREPGSSTALRSAGEDSNPEIPDLRGFRVLVVDDDPDTRELLTEILNRAGASPLTASSTREALAILDSHQPHLLISDIGMPGEDGHVLIRTIRTRTASCGGRIPAIALTAYTRAQDRRRSLTAGFQCHLTKPADPMELLAQVAALVGRPGEDERSSAARDQVQ
jgi:CheY-like chemotaxis protein